MTKPVVLVQLSDCHIGATWAEGDSIGGLKATIAAVEHLAVAPDAILFSGDLAEDAAPAEYELVRELMQALDVPLYVLPGNHDGRAAMRACFDLPGAAEAPIQYTADVGALRLVVLDSTQPGQDRGDLDAPRLEWLDRELSGAPERPTLLAMHHPPIAMGSPVWDAIGLSERARSALGEVVARHPQVLGIVAGHVHQTIVGGLASRPVLSAPSTYGQAWVGLGAKEIVFSEAVAGFAVHTLTDGVLTSYVQLVAYRKGAAGP